jgi:hypothetical protein
MIIRKEAIDQPLLAQICRLIWVSLPRKESSCEARKMPTYFTLSFSGYSMYPFLKAGDRLVINRVGDKSLHVGDIVLVRVDGDRFLVHRLVKGLPQGRWMTKGDSMLAPDALPVEPFRIEGRVDAFIRRKRIIPISSGRRALTKSLYAMLSAKNLTSGALRLRAKNALGNLFAPGLREDLPHARGLLIALLRGDSPEMPETVDWAGLSKLAFEEGVAGLLYPVLRQRAQPPDSLLLFREYHQATAALNLLHLDALHGLEKALCKEEVPLMALKGASLLDSVYSSIGMRLMEDIDLMVRPADRQRVSRMLVDMGYSRHPIFSNTFTKDRVVIDLHTHALNADRIGARSALLPCGMEPFWSASVPWGEGFRFLKRPDDADNLLLLSQHMVKHSFSRLIWFVDIHRLLSNRDLAFWERLAQRARSLKQERLLSHVLYALNGLLGYLPPQDSGHPYPSERISTLERAMLDTMIKGKPPAHLGPLLALFCIPGYGGRFRFMMETLFPRREVIENEFRMSSLGSGGLFYPFRLLQAALLLSKQAGGLVGTAGRRGAKGVGPGTRA